MVSCKNEWTERFSVPLMGEAVTELGCQMFGSEAFAAFFSVTKYSPAKLEHFRVNLSFSVLSGWALRA